MADNKSTSNFPKSINNYLRKYQGIDLDATPKNLKDLWLKLRYNRKTTRLEIDYGYEQMRSRLIDSKKTLNSERESLRYKWGIDFDVPLNFEAIAAINWRNPDDVILSLPEVIEQLPSRDVILEKASEIEQKERAAWIEELMESAKSQKASFIAVKEKNFRSYHDPDGVRFSEYARTHEECYVRGMFGALEWFTCPIEKLPEVLREGFGSRGLGRANCSVEFFC